MLYTQVHCINIAFVTMLVNEISTHVFVNITYM